MAFNKVLKATTDAELLSYIINQTPELASDIDLPKQGESIAPIGKLIMNNQRYKNAFINTVNLIGLTVIKRNGWDNPWDFTNRGTLRYGQQVRELIIDLCNVYDYNAPSNNETRFLANEVPNVFNYMHEINFQKFYETTTSEAQMAMAFDSEGGLFDFVEQCIAMLYESYQYDKFLVDKYIIARRLLDGTVTPAYLANFATMTPRQRVSAIKDISNKMTFRSPNYNPAGVRRATKFEDQILIVSTKFEAEFSTEVLATSFFKDEADMRSRLVLTDSFKMEDTVRLAEILGTNYVAFTEAEQEALAAVPAVLISKEWFMDYTYALDAEGGMKTTEFFNPTTLKLNTFLHVWGVFSSSPYENCAVFSTTEPAVTNVAINPSESTVSAGQDIQLSATVTATGFANKAVVWTVDEAPGETTGKVTVDLNGRVHIPADYTPTATDDPNPIVITATSVYDDEVSGSATITVL